MYTRVMQFKWEIYYLFCYSNNLKKLNDYLLQHKEKLLRYFGNDIGIRKFYFVLQIC